MAFLRRRNTRWS